MGTSFKKCRGKTGGRTKGTPNKGTAEGRALCRELVVDKEYQRRFRERFVRGELSANFEALVWHYAFGKPRQTEENQTEYEGPSELRITVVKSRVIDPKITKCVNGPLKEIETAKRGPGL